MLELAVFAYYEDSRVGFRAPKVMSTISMEESSLQVIFVGVFCYANADDDLINIVCLWCASRQCW
jgi:hypothetical protein